MTGIGPVAVRQPRVRDREAAASDPRRIRFSPSILPPYMRRSKSIETLLPVLYLKGISTGDFSEALAALLGKDAAGLSASAIGRLKDGWLDEHARWQKRDLSARRYVYVWADGIHLQARLEDEKQCILVLIGATPEGRKELVGFTDGARESAHDWRELLLDLKRRGLDAQPELVIADRALGFWKAAGEVWPKAAEQRCWVHKTANVLNKLPKSQQPKAKRALQEIWMAETKAAAEAALDAFIESYTLKYVKAADCLAKDRDVLLAFYDFPAEHWKHLRTTNPIESTFATVRHRTIRAKGCLSNKTALAMVFKLVEGAQKTWRRLDGHVQLPKLILGVKFADGLEVAAKAVRQPDTALIKPPDFELLHRPEWIEVPGPHGSISTIYPANEFLKKPPKHTRVYGGGVVFKPSGTVSANQYNPYKGMHIQPNPSGSCDLFYDLLLRVWCSGDQETYEWVREWFMHVVAYPGE